MARAIQAQPAFADALAYGAGRALLAHAALFGSVVVITAYAVWSLNPESDLRYVLYGVAPALVLAGAVIHRGLVPVERAGGLAFAIIAGAATLTLVVNPQLDSHARRDLFIIGSYFVLFALPFRASAFLATGLLVACAIAMAIRVSLAGLGSDFDLMSSQGIAETTLAFPLGVLAIFFISRGNLIQATVTLLLLVLSFKRIAFAGLVLALVPFLIGWLFASRTMRNAAAVLIVALSACAALFSRELFEFAVVALDLENANSVSISLGRDGLAAILWDARNQFSTLEQLFGTGPGSAEQTLIATGITMNPHNDWLKILFDYGLFGFLAFNAALFVALRSTPVGIAIYVYTGVLFVTDNVLIYMHYFLVVALVQALANRPRDPGAAGA